MEYLIAVDLEGAHGVVGEPYKGLLPGMQEYRLAVANITREVNAAIAALYVNGATKVCIWDNHGNLNNLDFTEIDSRAEKIKPVSNDIGRLDFVRKHDFCAMLLLGYHAKEGALNGVLAHTYSSSDIQYYKLGGHSVGEADIDSIIAAALNVPVIFLSGDDVCVKEYAETCPRVVTAVTKIGKGRNAAEFRDPDTVLAEIGHGVAEALKRKCLRYPETLPCTIEVRYTRTEYAAQVYARFSENGLSVSYGEDAHILTGVVQNIDELRIFL